MRLMQESYMYT